MKNINIYMKTFVAAVIAIVCLNSCDLTRLPEDSLSPENYFQTETDLLLWTNSFYSMFETSEVAYFRN